ncbi:MAG TPA: hypothetical protein VHV83_05760, partial [Armatimonadota bacterium]|nr:hypothetical protein [Armatimonadota bacterium]
MPTLNSGNQDGDNNLVTAYIPLLATVAVQAPVLYIVLLLANESQNAYYLEWFASVVLSVLGLRFTITREFINLRWLAILANGLLPITMLITGALSHTPMLIIHGSALLLLLLPAWVPVLLVFETTGKQLRQLNGGGTPSTDNTISPPPTRAILTLVIVIGTIIFTCCGANKTAVTVVSPIPFALLFFLSSLGLLSLTKLVQKVHETPQQPITFAPEFVHRWLYFSCVILLIALVAALLLPKPPLKWAHSLGSRVPSQQNSGMGSSRHQLSTGNTHNDHGTTHNMHPSSGNRSATPSARGMTPTSTPGGMQNKIQQHLRNLPWKNMPSNSNIRGKAGLPNIQGKIRLPSGGKNTIPGSISQHARDAAEKAVKSGSPTPGQGAHTTRSGGQERVERHTVITRLNSPKQVLFYGLSSLMTWIDKASRIGEKGTIRTQVNRTEQRQLTPKDIRQQAKALKHSLKTHPKRLLKVLAAILVFLGMMIGMIYGVRRFFRRKMSTPLSPSVS